MNIIEILALLFLLIGLAGLILIAGLNSGDIEP
jgi:hypothetical protein